MVTPRSAGAHPALDRLRAAGYDLVFPAPGALPTAEQQCAGLVGAVGYLAGVERIPREVLAEAAELRVIARNGTGADGIDLAAAQELGIEVRRAPAANAQGVAELAIALMLAAARRLPAVAGALRDGRWERERGIELGGRTLALIGCGQIGRRVAGVALALGMRVRAHDPYADVSLLTAGEFEFASLPAALAGADVVSLHAPPGSAPVIDAAALATLAPGAILVNTARASLVDEHAVLAALNSGTLGGYAADVFDPEPPGRTPLVAHPRFIGTPHIGGFTTESVDRALSAAVDHLIESLDSGRGRVAGQR